MENRNDIIVLVIEQGCLPYLKRIQNTPESIQELLGGTFESIYPSPGLALVMLEDALTREDRPLNRTIKVHKESEFPITAVVAGTFFMCSVDEHGFASLNESQIETYRSRFYRPEQFVFLDDKLEPLPMRPIRQTFDQI